MFLSIPNLRGRLNIGNKIPSHINLNLFRTDANAAAEAPKSTATKVPALVDTGAGESCIDNALAVSLGLPVIDKRIISGASGHDEVPVYLAHIVVPSLGFTQYGGFAGVKLTDGGQLHQVLIGRTFLQNMIMIYDGLRGQVTIAL